MGKMTAQAIPLIEATLRKKQTFENVDFEHVGAILFGELGLPHIEHKVKVFKPWSVLEAPTEMVADTESAVLRFKHHRLFIDIQSNYLNDSKNAPFYADGDESWRLEHPFMRMSVVVYMTEPINNHVYWLFGDAMLMQA